MKILCDTCEHSILCGTWGEYKCLKYGHRVGVGIAICAHYQERTPKEERPKCRCEECEELKGDSDDE